MLKKLVALCVAVHLARCMSDYMYWYRCSGILTSIFASGSPMCRGLRQVSDTVTYLFANHAAKIIGLDKFVIKY